MSTDLDPLNTCTYDKKDFFHIWFIRFVVGVDQNVKLITQSKSRYQLNLTDFSC